MDSIPVRFPQIYEGFANAEGVLSISSDALTLEFQVKDNILGVMKSGVRTAVIPFDRIDEVDFRSNLFRTGLNISEQFADSGGCLTSSERASTSG